MANQLPQISVIGAGIFVKTQYIPRLAEISHLFVLKSIWSRSEESAREAVEVAKEHFPGVECKWGDKGLDEIIQDESILGVAVVLAAQYQVDMSLKLLKAGKHVLQEKPAASSISEIETSLSSYKSICANSPGYPIWAVAENYRFEPALLESKKLLADIGKMMSVQLIIEASMNSANPYFSSSWRRNYTGGFILDMGVHFIAGLRMLVGCEVTSVSAMTSHVDTTLPPPDNISSVFHLENGCSGVFAMVVSSKSPRQILWRIVGINGTVEIGRGKEGGQHGYTISFYGAGGHCKSNFYPFSGVTDELKAFLHHISQANLQGSSYEVEPRLSFIEGARDVAVLDAMLESGNKNGALVQVKKF
ncbi:dTDP-3,4-didehydro-2,6-dideoxy-alpha-D-glucose reductase [Salix suchowensis]|nr:dTDP-3,4-didehydro-2,6-dideoxy-alpha-D-glucose reductase [Salix suchowensis]